MRKIYIRTSDIFDYKDAEKRMKHFDFCRKKALECGLICRSHIDGMNTRAMFPGCIVTKLDSSDIQGIPDLLVLYKDKWAALEVKKSATASHRPNQDYYVAKMNAMSFSRFIYPENKEDVLDELRESFKA